METLMETVFDTTRWVHIGLGFTASNPKIVQLDFGPLPVDLINRTTGLELENGNAFFSINAQKHAAKRHPLDYSKA